MSNMRPFIIALAFGLIAVALVYFYIKKVEGNQTTQQIPMVKVVRATANIPPRTNITEQMLEEIEVPEEMVTADTVTELEEILGQVSVTAIYQNQILMNPMFKAETELQDPSRMLDEGDRAITVGVSEVSGLGGNLMPGDNVDVLCTILASEEVGVASTFTVLRDIQVMAVGQDIGFTGDETEPSAGVSKSVTLEVNPSDAEILALASEVGSIRLALRNPNDQFSPSTGGTALTEFTKYTPTRKDLADMAQQQRQLELDAQQAELERLRVLAEIRGTTTVSDTQPESDWTGYGELPELGPPPVTVELILGGQSQIVTLEQ
ncbi:MAG: Flp pilus assembly protein CpaB [bacterium]|nr:Flp pilus assembly protein CpaB [bacterium]